MGGSGCPCPLCSSCALPRATGGAGRGSYSRRGGWKAACCHCALEFPHQDASGDGPPSTLQRGGGGRTRALASPVNLGTHWAWLSPGAGQGPARRRSCGNMKSQKSEVAGCKGQETRRLRQAGRTQSAPAGVGRERPKRRAPPSVYSPKCPPSPWRGAPSSQVPLPPQPQFNPCSSSKAQVGDLVGR